MLQVVFVRCGKALRRVDGHASGETGKPPEKLRADRDIHAGQSVRIIVGTKRNIASETVDNDTDQGVVAQKLDRFLLAGKHAERLLRVGCHIDLLIHSAPFAGTFR